MHSTIIEFLKDIYAFPVLQGAFFLLIAYAVYVERKNFKNSGVGVSRGEVSWKYFGLIYGALAAIFTVLNDGTKALEDYKVVINLADFIGLAYLCFRNAWAKNLIIRTVVNSKERME